MGVPRLLVRAIPCFGQFLKAEKCDSYDSPLVVGRHKKARRNNRHACRNQGYIIAVRRSVIVVVYSVHALVECIWATSPKTAEENEAIMDARK
jgi:hypothetical protein